MFWRKHTPLMHCEVLHSLPGRVRIGCRALGYLEDDAGDVLQRLQEMAPVTSARVSTITANILVTYEHGVYSETEILELVESAVGAFALTAYKAERAEKSRLTVNERRLQEEPISEMVTRVAVTSVSLLFAWLRPGAAAPATGLLRRFLTMPAMTSMSLSAPIFRSGWDSMRTRMRPNADTLSATAILASIISGRDTAALTIIWLADIAELLTAYTMERTRKAIREMLAVGEEVVWRLREDGSEERVPLEDLRAGDRIMVPTGEKISVDGVVESGEAAVDQASITGEFMPLSKGESDQVFAGTVVKSGRLVIRAEKVGDETAVARIVHLVEEASHRKASIQSMADRVSAQFIPINFLLALVVFGITRSTSRALNMLIIDYSCGVRLSTATALSAAICSAARNGILIKGGNYLEMLSDADTLILDKTGTMTEGRPHVTSIIPQEDSATAREVIRLAAAAEEASTHPLAVAVVGYARRKGWAIPSHSGSEIHAALGVQTTVGRSVIRVGRRRFLEENGIDTGPAVENARRLASNGESIVYVARGKKLIGLLGIQDALRENMKKSLNRLRQSGFDDIILLTGDVEQHAEIVATRMAMDSYHAEVMPDDKAETVLKLQSKGARVVMVGDGVNDAPALAYADVGIAMGGTRTDIAMEAADVTIAGDDPLMIPAVIRMAQKTMNIVRQNFATAISVNSLGIVMSAVGVLPVFWGAVLHNATTVAVVLNSSRLLFHEVERER
jgi:cation-transporting P-type ATPase C